MMFDTEGIVDIYCRRKTSTIRNKQRLKVGETSNLMANYNYSKILGIHLKITKVYSRRLFRINDNIAQKDGFIDKKDFKRYWKKQFKAWKPLQKVYIHEFEVEKDV